MFMTTDSIIYNGRNSLLDFGLTIASKEFISPEIKEIREEIPYMDGDYDFTLMNGKPHYGNRQITVVFNIKAENYTDLFQKRTDIVQWLLSERGGALKFDCISGWQFENVSAKIGEFVRRNFNCAQLTVTFTCAPYLSNSKTDKVLIPSCPPYKGNTFGYIQHCGATVKTCTTNSSSGEVEFSASTVDTAAYREYTVTENTPSEFVISVHLSSNAVEHMQIEDHEGGVTNIFPEAVVDSGGNKLAVYYYSSAKYPDAGVIRFYTDITSLHTISAYTFDSTFPALPAPIRCRRGDTDIQFSVNDNSPTHESKLSLGGNIITLSGTSSAEIYMALRRETL